MNNQDHNSNTEGNNTVPQNPIATLLDGNATLRNIIDRIIQLNVNSQIQNERIVIRIINYGREE